jgi:uncharacterized protein (TIGR03118 family)
MLALAGMGGLAGTASAGTVAAEPAAPASDVYRQTNLVSDIAGVARVTDPSLVNPWGMSEGPGTPVWVSNNNNDSTTFYSGDQGGTRVTQQGRVRIAGGAPTGQVFNPTSDFVVHSGTHSAAAFFIFASENGHITGWNPAIPPGTVAVGGVTVKDAVYKGLAIASTGLGNFLYAANFHSGQIDVFDGKFQMVQHPGLFEDTHLPKNYAPFNVAVFGNSLYVTYAQQNAAMHDDVHGPGHGFVDVFSLDGLTMHRLITRGPLNSPWGMVMAPQGFGAFSGDLLIGNFGDGGINAFDPNTGTMVGTMMNRDGRPIAIEGLWGLIFGDAAIANSHTLLFSAGIAGEQHGLLGSLSPA